MTGKLEDFIKEEKIIKELLVPRNKLIMVMGGVKLITDNARASCDKVIIDTTGLIV